MECQSARFGSQERTGRWRVAHKCTGRHATLHPPAALTRLTRLLCSFPRTCISFQCIWPWSWAARNKMVAMTQRDEGEVVNGEEGKFEAGRPPPFRIGDIRVAIPSHCWVKNPWRSMSYVLRDAVVIAALAAAVGYLDSWIIWPIYWLAQGTMFWALFVLGHDWRISHRTHHQNHGNVDKDESWHPVSPDYSDALLEWNYLRGGLTTIDRDYGWINNIHHDIGTHVMHHLFPQIPHYNLVEAVSLHSPLISYSFPLPSHHQHCTGLASVISFQTKAAKPVLGKYYREPEKSGPLPLHLFGVLLRSLRVDHFVSDEGEVVYYQTDPQPYGDWQQKSK
ncbi:hypothetical protein BHM03_00041068 [Ensete ventricosum]|uniref:Fatty acid desaturase N-terminal domain-containing protein n=1 Tax=Ensete ventricosum TaxID=4639 RepID=A0A445MK58_ENSVE|nr:hypothetical protein BHM03_00041068 [Ensete ventricosum]